MKRRNSYNTLLFHKYGGLMGRLITSPTLLQGTKSDPLVDYRFGVGSISVFVRKKIMVDLPHLSVVLFARHGEKTIGMKTYLLLQMAQ
jgi:hypothetical protein